MVEMHSLLYDGSVSNQARQVKPVFTLPLQQQQAILNCDKGNSLITMSKFTNIGFLYRDSNE